jgi:histone H3/H4
VSYIQCIYSNVCLKSRVKKTIKLDPEVKNVKKEAVVALTKATEIFLQYLSLRANHKTQERKCKSIRDTDVVSAIYSSNNELLHFLKMDFPRKLVKPNVTKKISVRKKTPVIAPVAITKFFGAVAAGVAA